LYLNRFYKSTAFKLEFVCVFLTETIISQQIARNQAFFEILSFLTFLEGFRRCFITFLDFL